MRRTLRSRIFVGMGALALVFILAGLMGSAALLGGIVEWAAADRLMEARTSLDRYLQVRQLLLEVLAGSIAEAPRLKALLGEDPDQPTALDAARRAKLKDLDFVLLVDAHGRLLADTDGVLPFGQPLAGSVPLDRVLAGERVNWLWDVHPRLALAGAAPIQVGQRVLGAVVACQRVDASLAQEIHEAVGTEVLILHGQSLVAQRGARAGSARGTETLVDELNAVGVEPVRSRASDSVLLAAQPMGPRTRIVLVRSADDLRARFHDLRTWILVSGLLSAVAAMGISQLLSRKLARPLQRLVDASAEVARGNLAVNVATGSGTEEITVLEAAFNHMTRQVRQLVDEVCAKASVLEQQKEELQWSNKMKSQFLTTASHELRTPVAGIRSCAEILARHGGDSDPAARQEFLGMVCSGAERLSRLLDQIMELAALEAGTVTWDRTRLDLRELLESALAALRPEERERVTLLRPGQPAPFVGDGPRLLQAVHCLLENAFKFGPPGGPVRLSLAVTPEGYELAVADRGPGIPDARDKERIFQVFVQGGDPMTAKPGGAGLGLALCRSLVAAHGGRVLCEDHEGGGALFRVILPARLAPALDAVPAPVAVQLQGAGGTARA